MNYNYQKILFPFYTVFLFASIIVGPQIACAQPKISNFEMLPKEIGFNMEVTISFDYENVEGGLKEAKVFLIQKFQFPGEEKIITRTSNWQVYLTDLFAYPSESGRVEKKFVNPDRWPLPEIELTYELQVIDKNGKESNIIKTKIRPKR